MNASDFARHLQKLPKRTRSILATCVYGLAAGVATVAFQFTVNLLYRQTFARLAQEPANVFLPGSFAVIVGASLLTGYLLSSFCPDAAGSGIPQLKLAFWKEFGVVSWRAVWVKFVAGIVSLGGGLSLGREGPSVHFAGGLASNLAGMLGEAKQNRRMAAACGAAAGLAAAFNTPLAAVTFVLEEIIEDLNSVFLGSVLLASVIGAFVVHGLIGRQPAFRLGDVDAPTWKCYVLTPLVAALSGLVGMLFQKLTLDLRAERRRFSRVPYWLRPLLGGIITWSLGVSIFLATGHLGVFSLGYDDLSLALENHLGWELAGVLLAAKLIATFSCYGSGGCGGIFSPTLFLGGMCGVFLAGLLAWPLHLDAADHVVLAVVGMSACLGAVVRAPVTGILIVFEMTHQFSLVPALMLGALASQAVSRKLAARSFYEAVLVQDGHQLEHVIPPRDLQGWHQLPVSAITNFQPVVIGDLQRDTLQKALEEHPYERFPVTRGGRLLGILTRREAVAALREGREPGLLPAATCLRSQTIRQLQMLLIESPSLMVAVLDRPTGELLGIVTLHDLLRAEVSITERGAA